MSLVGGASASIATGGIATQNTAPVILAEEEISDVSLAAFFVFDKEMAGARSVRVAADTEGAATEAAADEVVAEEAVADEAAAAVEGAAMAAAARLRWRRRLLSLDRRRSGLLVFVAASRPPGRDRLSWRIVSGGWLCQPLARKQTLRAVAAPRCWSEQPFIPGHFQFTQCSFHLR